MAIGPNAINKYGQMLLHVAARCEDPFTTEILIKHGADVNARSVKQHGFDASGSTPLHIAAKHGHVQVMELLLSTGADVNAASDNGETPLRKAMQGGSEEAARLLLEHGAQHDIFTAAALGDLRVLQELMDNFFIHSREPFKLRTPLHLASLWGQTTIVEYILSCSSLTCVGDIEGCRPLHLAENCDIARMLIKSGASVRSRSNSRRTPLHYTTSGDVAALLIEHGADVNCRSSFDETPLHHCNKELAQVILAAGADIEAINLDGQTPLLSIVYREDLDDEDLKTIEFLIASGANVNAQDNEGNTPLHYATIMDSLETVILLITHSANVSASNNEGCIPIHYASEIVKETLKNYWETE